MELYLPSFWGAVGIPTLTSIPASQGLTKPSSQAWSFDLLLLGGYADGSTKQDPPLQTRTKLKPLETIIYFW